MGEDAALDLKAATGVNSIGRIGYMGSRPPPTDSPKNILGHHIHVYRLFVYALCAPTRIRAGFTLEKLMRAMRGTIFAVGELRFSYSND